MTENEALEILNNECEDISKVQIALKVAREALAEIQQYRAIGTIEELRDLKSRLQSYKNQMSIYAEQHKVILASDVLEALEELEW